jgi:hypothetical protein
LDLSVAIIVTAHDAFSALLKASIAVRAFATFVALQFEE